VPPVLAAVSSEKDATVASFFPVLLAVSWENDTMSLSRPCPVCWFPGVLAAVSAAKDATVASFANLPPPACQAWHQEVAPGLAPRQMGQYHLPAGRNPACNSLMVRNPPTFEECRIIYRVIICHFSNVGGFLFNRHPNPCGRPLLWSPHSIGNLAPFGQQSYCPLDCRPGRSQALL
jgi:hypothetical protein